MVLVIDIIAVSVGLFSKRFCMLKAIFSSMKNGKDIATNKGISMKPLRAVN